MFCFAFTFFPEPYSLYPDIFVSVFNKVNHISLFKMLERRHNRPNHCYDMKDKKEGVDVLFGTVCAFNKCKYSHCKFIEH